MVDILFEKLGCLLPVYCDGKPLLYYVYYRGKHMHFTSRESAKSYAESCGLMYAFTDD